MSYSKSIIEHKADLLRRKAEGEATDLNLVFAPVDWSAVQENDSFFTWLLKHKIATRANIKNYKARDKVKTALGRYPETCCEYVALYAKMLRSIVTYDGQISVVTNKGGRAFKIITDYQIEARVFASEYDLPFAREAINDAVQVWHESTRMMRLEIVKEELAPYAEFDWVELARRCFDCSEMSPELVAAILRKYVYQVKRKLLGEPVGYHLMPVILGPQGCGKSWFLFWLTQPLAEFRRDTDFKAIGDERNIGLWSSYVLIVDEMAYADKSDIEVVKHVITADMLDRRPMRRNDSVRVRQCATLIGASNKAISELIRDETGSRRFAGINFRDDADRDYLNSLSALNAWRSVPTNGVDPMEEFRAELATLQAREQHVSPVQDWLRSLHPRRHDILPSTSTIPPQTLYEAFVAHFQARNVGQRPKTRSAWEQELGRLMKDGTCYAIEKVRTASGVQWRWSANGGQPL